MSVGPNGELTVAPQEGEWTPATRINIVARGGHYGYEPARRRAGTSNDADPPLLWLPRAADNSAP